MNSIKISRFLSENMTKIWKVVNLSEWTTSLRVDCTCFQCARLMYESRCLFLIKRIHFFSLQMQCNRSKANTKQIKIYKTFRSCRYFLFKSCTTFFKNWYILLKHVILFKNGNTGLKLRAYELSSVKWLCGE